MKINAEYKEFAKFLGVETQQPKETPVVIYEPVKKKAPEATTATTEERLKAFYLKQRNREKTADNIVQGITRDLKYGAAAEPLLEQALTALLTLYGENRSKTQTITKELKQAAEERAKLGEPTETPTPEEKLSGIYEMSLDLIRALDTGETDTAIALAINIGVAAAPNDLPRAFCPIPHKT